MLIDSHAHLNFPDFGDALEFPGVEKIVVVGTSLLDSEKAIELAQKHKYLFATVGIHPHDPPSPTASGGQEIEDIDWDKFETLAKHAVAIGECGLDYSRSNDRERQEKLLAKQIEVAKSLDLPLILHVRDAQEDLIGHFGHSLEKMRGVFHCFSGDMNYLNSILNLLPGFYISFAGNITYRNAQHLRDLAKLVPIERLLVETDSPFLAPEPHRGTNNSPTNVKIVAEKLAEIKGAHFEQIAEATRKNAETLFII